MNSTEARIATLRALYGWLNFNGELGSIKSAIVAEIAAIEAEASGAAPAATTGTKFGGPGGSVVAEPYIPKIGDRVSRIGVLDSHSITWIVNAVSRSGVEAVAVVDGSKRGRTFVGYHGSVRFLGHATPAERIAAGLDKAPPAPPPARPKRVRVTDNKGWNYTNGKVYDVLGWNYGGCPKVITDDGIAWYYLGTTKWVPADEPEVDEAMEREAFCKFARSSSVGYTLWTNDAGQFDDNTTEFAWRCWLARAKVKP